MSTEGKTGGNIPSVTKQSRISSHSSSTTSQPRYLYQLPYSTRRELCRILDADGRWRELAEFFECDLVDIRLFAQSVPPKGSSTEEVLQRGDQRMCTINGLFRHLRTMQHHRAMLCLRDFVSEKYRNSIPDISDSVSSTTTCLSQIGISVKPSAPPYSGGFLEGAVGNARYNHASQQATRPQDHNNANYAKVGNPENNNNIEGGDGQSVPPKPPRMDEAARALNEATVKKLSYRELAAATDNFADSQIIGKGGFGAVYRGTWMHIHVAVKRLHVREDTTAATQQHVKQSLNELNVLKKSRFKNILNLYGVSIDGPAPCLMYEYMPNGSLQDWLHGRDPHMVLNWLERARVARGTACGLHYLHTNFDKSFIHGDIKPANILMDNDLEPKLGDFGLTREGPDAQFTHLHVSHVHGTRYYLPHEYLQSKELSVKVDVYSYGIVLLELATGLRVYDEKRPRAKMLVQHVAATVESGRGLDTLCDVTAGEDNTEWFGQLLQLGVHCSQYHKQHRPTMDEVVKKLAGEAGRGVVTAVVGAGHSRDPTALVGQAANPLHEWKEARYAAARCGGAQVGVDNQVYPVKKSPQVNSTLPTVAVGESNYHHQAMSPTPAQQLKRSSVPQSGMSPHRLGIPGPSPEPVSPPQARRYSVPPTVLPAISELGISKEATVPQSPLFGVQQTVLQNVPQPQVVDGFTGEHQHHLTSDFSTSSFSTDTTISTTDCDSSSTA